MTKKSPKPRQIKGNKIYNANRHRWVRMGASIHPGCKSIRYSKNKHYYLNIHHHRWMKTYLGDWKNGPLIYKVPLYPEQAVLNCCSTSAASGGTKIRFGIIAPTVCADNGGTHDHLCNTGTGGKANCGFLTGSRWRAVDNSASSS